LNRKVIRGDKAICEWMKQTNLYYDGFPWNRLISLKFLKANNVRCIPSHRNEDVYFSFQVVLYAKSFITLPNITYNYFLRPGSTVHRKIDEYYYNQFLEIFDARTKLMREIKIDKPSVLYNYYLQHFFEWWIDLILFGDFSTQKKTFFYLRMKEILNLKFGVRELIGIRYKLKYIIIKYGTYKCYKILSKIDGYFRYIYSIIQRLFNRPKLPYSHL
jgi:hypothetical protein